MEKKTPVFQELDQGVQHLVSIYGYDKAVGMVHNLCVVNQTINSPDQLELSVHFLIKKATAIFGITPKDIYEGKKQHMRDARMCCYYLLIRHLKMSYNTVGIYFKQKKRHVRYSYKKCEEILSIKSYYKDLYARLQRLEQLFVNYLIQ